jgi:hypothetical protein
MGKLKYNITPSCLEPTKERQNRCIRLSDGTLCWYINQFWIDAETLEEAQRIYNMRAFWQDIG